MLSVSMFHPLSWMQMLHITALTSLSLEMPTHPVILLEKSQHNRRTLTHFKLFAELQFEAIFMLNIHNAWFYFIFWYVFGIFYSKCLSHSLMVLDLTRNMHLAIALSGISMNKKIKKKSERKVESYVTAWSTIQIRTSILFVWNFAAGILC